MAYNNTIKEFRNCYLGSIEGDLNIKLTPEQERLRDSLVKLFREETWCVTAIGSVGNGKTMLGSALLNSVERCIPASTKYVTQAEILERGRNFNEAETINHLMNCKVLFIDELDIDEWCETSKLIVTHLIRNFYDRRQDKQLILAGNVSAEDFKKMMNERILDRLKGTEKIVMSGTSFRK